MFSFRRIAYGFALMLLCVGAACTGDEPQVSSPSLATPSGGPVTSNQAVAFEPGAYRYTFNGVVASLTLDGSTGALDVENDSGTRLGAPSIYAITGDGARYEATIEGAAPIADQASDSLTVSFPDAVTADTAGLLVLSFGSDNVGAFAPVPVRDA